MRSRFFGICVIVLMVFSGVFLYAPKAEAAGTQTLTVQTTAYQYYKMAFDVLDEINEARSHNEDNLPALKMDRNLMDAAMQRAAERAVYSDTKQTRPSGSSFLTADDKARAENAFSGPLGDGASAETMEGWWHTPESIVADWRSALYRPGGAYLNENLYNPKYVTAGVGVVRIGSSVYWVVLFGDQTDNEAEVSRTDYPQDKQVLWYPKIKVSVKYLQSGKIQVWEAPEIPEDLQVGDTGKISLMMGDAGAGYCVALLRSKLSFTSSDPETVSVTSEGEYTVLKQGQAVITVRSRLNGSSAPALISLDVPDTGAPRITRQPEDTAAELGKEASFMVEAEGNGLSFQWYYRKSASDTWKAINPARGSEQLYVVTTKAYQNGYQYRCEVKNSKGTVYSNVVTLNVTKAAAKPKIITQPPEAVSVLAGEKATFSIKAEGADLSYQWYFRTSSKGTWKKTNLSAGTEDTYVLTAKLKQNGYQYRCKVSNSAGTVYSKALTLKVSNTAVKPKIVSQPPKSLSASVGKKVTFSVKAEGENLTYQWYFRTASGSWKVVNMADGTKSTYSFTPKIKQNGNQYRCKVSNGAGYVYSSILTLKVQ